MPLGPATLYHLNVNCRDLSRSLAFYVDQLGFAPLVRTVVDPQSCRALGIEHGAWDAWMLAGHRGHSGALLDLLEWKLPEPAGQPPDAAGLGYSAVIIETPAAEPGARVDPDGTLVEVRHADHTRLAGVRHSGTFAVVPNVALIRGYRYVELVVRSR